MENKLSTQYDNFAEVFSVSNDMEGNGNRDNRRVFYTYLDFIKPGIKLLDVACGDGFDMAHYKGLGADVYGVDASQEFVKMAKHRLPDNDIRVGVFEKLPYENDTFDAIVSKYAIQTSANVTPCFDEIYRVLKPGGTLLFLVTHPMRHYFEKKDAAADYFEQKVVNSNIFNNALTVREPTHTLNEYLTDRFLERFDVKQYGEYWDRAAEQIDGKKYPGYFILKATKRDLPPQPLRFAVISSASDYVSPQNRELAEGLGAYLAKEGITVVTGGSHGVPGIVTTSAFMAGGDTEAYSPDSDEEGHHKRSDNLSLRYFKKCNFVPGFTARSLEMLKSVDGVIVLNGRMGTLSEFSIALEEGVPTAVVTGTEGVADHLETIVGACNKSFMHQPVFADDYKIAVDALVRSARGH